MSLELWNILLLALGLGMLHALDADHVIAVTGLSSIDLEKKDKKLNRKKSIIFCGRWAIGHGGALIIIGSAVFFLGMAIPETLSNYAENSVGIVLVMLGIYVLLDIRRNEAHVHFHQHEDGRRHMHWHTHKQTNKETVNGKHKHEHAPVLVGLLHGIAGSAPLLVLLPLAKMSSPWVGIMYLILFAIGVFIAMMFFGGLIGHMFLWTKQWGNGFINVLRTIISIVSIGYGINLMMVGM